MKIAIAQMNSRVGDFEGNLKKTFDFLQKAKGADLVVFPEASLCGYPQQDLLDYPSFAKRSEEATAKVSEASRELKCGILLGSVHTNKSGGRPYRNSAVFLQGGKSLLEYWKRLLPTYDVFDEDRYFEPGQKPGLLEFGGKKLAITICEDIWNQATTSAILRNRYSQSPLKDAEGAEIVLNISASPFEYAKVKARRELLQTIAKNQRTILVYANAIGANDGIIFEGNSTAWNEKGNLFAAGAHFQEDLILIDTEASAKTLPLPEDDEIKNIYEALVLGIREYARKQSFSSALVGMSGGIDSALVTCLAADALGNENVVGVLMPSRYTSVESTEDAFLQAKAMQNPVHLLPIEFIFQAALKTLEKTFEGTEPDIAEENLQSRARGMLLMGISNKFKSLLLTTGNKSELAVGYCTLYGDMCGGLAPISDVYKMQVYALAKEANRRIPGRIPERVFSKAPTAELRANQKDQDTLPPYERLDRILKAVLEDFRSEAELVEAGFPAEEVRKVLTWIRNAEYKRFQMPLGLKVSSKAFGIGRRIPIEHRFF